MTDLISKGFRRSWGVFGLILGGAPQNPVADPGPRLGGVALLAWGTP